MPNGTHTKSTRRAINPPPQPAAPEPAPASTPANAAWFKPAQLEKGYEYDIAIEAPIKLYTGGEFGHSILLGVRFEEGHFTWSLVIGKQQYLRLEKRLGKDLCEWPGRIVPVKLGDFNGKPYIEVVEG